MSDELLAQLKSWNPWWEQGLSGMGRYKDPEYKREQYSEIQKQYLKGTQVVGIVGMRQVGKSTIIRQIIRELLENSVDPNTILYVSFDDPYLLGIFNKKTLFDQVVSIFCASVLKESLDKTKKELYFFFDEIHQIPNWEKTLKAYYDRSFPVKYLVSGSSSLRLQQKNRESLLGRISEHILWPFSFREYVEFHSKDKRIVESISEIRAVRKNFLSTYRLSELPMANLMRVFKDLDVWSKPIVLKYLREFIIIGGFPRVWQQPDLASQHRTLWDHHVGKVLFEDLPQVAKIRKVKDLEFLYIRLVDYNGSEAKLGQIKADLGIHWETLDRYLEYLQKTFLIFRIDRTKTKRFDRKRRSGNVKFYVTDVALRNSLRRKTEAVFDDPQEMSYIAENLVCTTIHNWIPGVRRGGEVGFYRNSSGEVDFVFKHASGSLPVEVKWRNDIDSLKTLDRICSKWDLSESILVTKDFPLVFKSGRLSIPLWFYLMVF